MLEQINGTPLPRKTAKAPSVVINVSIRKSLYFKAVKLAAKRGVTLQEILRNLLSESISDELIN